MKHTEAYPIARRLLSQLAPDCHQAKIAGSLRRGIADVGDIEIIVQPTLATDLFSQPDPLQYCALDATLDCLSRSGTLGQAIKGGQRYKQFALPQGINLDLFIVRPPAQWGVIFALRTGPESFSQWIVTKRKKGGALPSHLKVKKGGVYYKDDLLPMATETAFFTTLGLDWIEPSRRTTYVRDISKPGRCPTLTMSRT